FNNDKLPPEKKFYEFLSHELKVDEVQAIRNFTDYTARLNDDLNKNHTLYFKGIGTLTRQTSHAVNFQPEEMPDYSPSLTAERIIRKNASHTVRVGEEERTSEEMQTVLHQPQKAKKERWWIAAAILGVIGIAAIIFYYTMHR
ncbi:MAG: hypothetical protein JO072_15735, partial [Parafilimonas sp.]|nr:hypothetical protein [Parafilimonas sp.]